jgi:DNA gyrase subunit A
VRVMGRTAGGVRGIKLDDGELLIGAAILPEGQTSGLHLLCVGGERRGQAHAGG